MSATEKVRREKWINEKTRKIKEITVRGGRLCPELAGAGQPAGLEAAMGSLSEDSYMDWEAARPGGDGLAGT